MHGGAAAGGVGAARGAAVARAHRAGLPRAPLARRAAARRHGGARPLRLPVSDPHTPPHTPTHSTVRNSEHVCPQRHESAHRRADRHHHAEGGARGQLDPPPHPGIEEADLYAVF